MKIGYGTKLGFNAGEYGINANIIVYDLVIVRISPNQVCLIETKDFDRWHNPIKVKDTSNLTTKEIYKLVGNEFSTLRYKIKVDGEYVPLYNILHEKLIEEENLRNKKI